jgi:hypothetical protein
MVDEEPNQSNRRAAERQATGQLTTLTSLLAGFAFAWFTSLIDKEHPTLFSLVVLVVTALTILLLLLASIVGALLTIASEITSREVPLRRAEALWGATTKSGILLFVATVALLPYRVSLPGHHLFDSGSSNGCDSRHDLGLDSEVFASAEPRGTSRLSRACRSVSIRSSRSTAPPA